MQKATITVSEGRFPEAHFDGRRTPEPTIGYALTRLADHARTKKIGIRVEVDDGLTRLPLIIDAQGRLHVQEPVPARPSFPPPPGHAPPAPTPPRRDATPLGASPAAQSPVPESAAAQQQPLRDLLTAEAAAGEAASSALLRSMPQQETRTFTPAGDVSPALTPPRPSGPPLLAVPDTPHAYPHVSLAAPIRSTLRDDGANMSEGSMDPALPGKKSPWSTRGRWMLAAAATVAALIAGSAVLMLTSPTAPAQDSAPSDAVADRGPAVVLSLAPSVTAGDPADSASGVPGFTEAAWSEAAAAEGSVTASAEGLLVIDRGSIKVLDPVTGKSRYSGTIDSPVTFAATGLVGGDSALVWRSEDTVWALLKGTTSPIEYSIAADAAMSAAGTSVLIRDGDALSTLGPDGLIALPAPAAGHTPIAVDEVTLVSGSVDGSVSLAEAEQSAPRDLQLASPGNDFTIEEWKAAGHGLAVTLWTSTDSADRRIAVHSLADGSLSAAADAPAAVVSDADWLVGQGEVLGTLGPYVFELETGELLIDASQDGIVFDAAYGDLAIGTAGDATIVVTGAREGSPISHATDAEVLAVVGEPTTAVVREADSLQGYVQTEG